MKKLIILLALVMPVVSFAQELDKKEQTTFEKFTSSIGSIVKFYDYAMPKLSGSYQAATVEVRKVISGSQSNCFLHIEFTPYQRSTQSAFIAADDLIEMKKALEELITLASTDSTGEADYMENKFRIKDGSYIGYYIQKNKSGDKEPTWYFNINGYSGGTIFFKTPDALLECFAGAIMKIDAIK